MNNNLDVREIKQKEIDDEYDIFEQQVTDSFDKMVGINTPLFIADVEDLWETYLNNLPESERQHYNCNACRHFIQRFGNLVTVNEKGQTESVIWGFEAPNFFKKSANSMRTSVELARIKRVFISDERVLGTPKTGIWTHMSVKLPREKVNKSRLLTAGQIMAEKSEDYRMLSRAVVEYDMDTVNTAVELLNTETLYRGDKCLGVANWFKELKEILSATKNSRAKENLRWLAVATAPTGFTHIKSSMIGTLLDDIQEGMSYESVSRRFADKMKPSNYMRSQSAPTQGAIEQAEKVVEKLGIAESLQRRFATIEEVPKFWENKNIEKKVETKKTSIFGNLTPKGSTEEKKSSAEMNLPIATMTWEKFAKTVLPTANNLEAKIDNPNRLMALVTAQNQEAENILQWDNTFSWYYHGGIDAEMKRRVESAGGQYENNEIRCSLMWENYSDLDISCITPNGNRIYFGQKRVDNGWLDIDMNVSADTNTPVENIRWSRNAPEGVYEFKVHNFCDRNKGSNPYKVELEVNGRLYVCEGDTGYSNRDTVFKFDYIKGQEPRMIVGGGTSVSSANDWDLETDTFVKVNAITSSPNTWSGNTDNNAGAHIFFLLDGCKDMSEGKGRGFFNEMLKPELRGIRKTLEAYMAEAPIEGIESATANGLGYNKDSEWNLIVKVTSNNSTRLVKIDRWD